MSQGLGRHQGHGAAGVAGPAPIELQRRSVLALEVEQLQRIPARGLDRDLGDVRELIGVDARILDQLLTADPQPEAVVRLQRESVGPGRVELTTASGCGSAVSN